jgi:hypothetical protein
MDSLRFIANLIKSIWFRKRPDVNDGMELDDPWFRKLDKQNERRVGVAKFEYKQGVSIPRIVFGCGLAKSMPDAVGYLAAELVQIDDEVVTDNNFKLELGDHEMYLEEHLAEMEVEEGKFEDVFVKRQGPKVFTIIHQPEEDSE